MRLVLQRVASASVMVDDSTVGSIGRGLLVLVGVETGDSGEDVDTAADKLANLRVFSDEVGKMNLNIGEISGQILLVSQFTLVGEVKRGRRPSFSKAAPPAEAERLVGSLVTRLRAMGVPTETGVFGAKMIVSLVNDGPVTFVVDLKNGALV